MLKRIVGLVVGTTVACSAFMAFAAEVNTTSTYGTETGKISVASEVTGVKEGQTLTYLAYKGVEDLADLKGTNIVYIDQVTLASDMEDFDELTSTYTFKYTADTTDIQSNVKIGGDAGTNTKPDAIAGPGCAVSVNGTLTDVVVEYDATGQVSIPYPNAAIAKKVSIGETVLAYETDWYQGVNRIIIKDAKKFTGNSVNVVIEDEEVNDESVIVTTTGIATMGDNSIIVVAKVDGSASEYGIKVKIGDLKEEYLPALGKGTDGSYAIKITGLDKGTEVVAQPYAGKNFGQEAFVTVGPRGYGKIKK